MNGHQATAISPNNSAVAGNVDGGCGAASSTARNGSSWVSRLVDALGNWLNQSGILVCIKMDRNLTALWHKDWGLKLLARENENMYTGWFTSFPVQRSLTQTEHNEALSREKKAKAESNERGGLVKLNSTFIDWIDRRFLVRGMMNTCIMFLMCVVIFFFAIWFSVYGTLFVEPDNNFIYYYASGMLIAIIVLFYFLLLKREFFTYTHFPIRFNRVTRKIYVFRHNGPEGVLTVAWDEVFFHIGHSQKTPNLCDIRGEVLEGETVKDTFALGHFFERPQPVLEMWEFIRRYMEEGPEAVGEHPLDRYVSLSVTGSFKNCLIMSRIFYGADSPFAQAISLPLVALSAVTRWLILKTCKVPVFPPEIESECVVEANDPNVWPIPESSGQFAAENPAIMARAVERAEKAATR
ncbi:hypothetical protein LT85_2328 [Collimonas arenae]|uniref:DUF6708 domain-containing protein n=1 Tax=Collimonas arenae TaxID=279058 RepID=A0A0A1FAB8_9BURK|nr:DUF6708 domain-containing protein [Collimonas arenae]AIY41486.1 hypothetical protein LT85_2328 [Collimonas arenae]